MFTYAPLMATIHRKGMKKTDLVNNGVLTSATLAKIGKDELVAMSVLDKICNELECRIEEVVEHVKDDSEPTE
ncbi:helix-turn-helix domain-containing protein [Peribacillus loiseleuriae]|uniref:XRE family transcriptional regulator n=1 Tax=Peribacillus loiseleuriae TaxID=1679170 RepID=A0A0K9GWB5_9BACI|nr:helix-turn-helix domain-containing protein [Peribacillus loiseleuriae]KMY50537.1 XRE family transcriptional regulator [Peribacillus loiseleuriae]